MKLFKLRVAVILLLCFAALCGCSMNIVPSQYDLKLKTKTDAVTVDIGGASSSIEITIDSRRYQELSSEQGIFLSYHLLSEEREMLIFDNERTALEPIDARGVKKEILNFTAPMDAGNYLLQVDLVEEGVTWFSEQGMPTLEIPLAVLDSYIPPYAEVSLHSATEMLEISMGDRVRIPLVIENGSSVPLYSTGEYATRISYHITDQNGNMLLFDGDRTELAGPLEAGETAEMQIEIIDDIFNTPGNYVINFDLVIEGVSWYGEQGMKALDIPVVVQAQ